MKNWLLPIILIMPAYANSYITGDGGIEIGVSRDKNKHNYGVSTNYSFNNVGLYANTSVLSKAQLGSDEGRSLVATAAHEYQYENSFFRTEINNEFSMFNPGLFWNSKISHDLEFEKINTSSGSESKTNFNDSTSNWSISTGPSFTYDRSRWLSYRAGITISQALLDDEVSSEGGATVGIGKRLSHVTTAYLDASNICTEDDVSSFNELCRNEIRLSIVSERNGVNLRLEYGRSNQKDTSTDLYLLSFEHQPNSYSTIDIGFKKSIDNIAKSNDINNSLVSSSKIQEEHSLIYKFDWGRSQLEIKARQLDVISANENIKTQDESIYYSYLLGAGNCASCSIESSYEYSEYGGDLYTKIKSIGIMKVHNRRASSTLSFRRTKIKNELDTWSVNLLFSYKGLLTKIGKR